MKLIYCPHCRDIVLLRRDNRACECGLSSGHYMPNSPNAVISGDAIPLGIHNKEFLSAIARRPDRGMGTEFKAFVIPHNVHTVRNLEREKEDKLVREIEEVFGEEATRRRKKRNTSHNHLIK